VYVPHTACILCRRLRTAGSVNAGLQNVRGAVAQEVSVCAYVCVLGKLHLNFVVYKHCISLKSSTISINEGSYN
jgi:hypothetical protein